MCRWSCLASEHQPVSPSQMYRSGSGGGEMLCVHSCWCQSANQLWRKTPSSLWCQSKPREALFPESRRGCSLSEIQNTASLRTWGLSAGGGDVIRITHLWPRKRSEHASIPAKNWCCWFERMLPDGKTAFRAVSSFATEIKSEVEVGIELINKLSGWRQVVKLQFKLN